MNRMSCDNRVVLESARSGGQLFPSVVRYGDSCQHLVARAGVQEHQVPAEAPCRRAQGRRRRA